jgi:hypothetical protein
MGECSPLLHALAIHRGGVSMQGGLLAQAPRNLVSFPDCSSGCDKLLTFTAAGPRGHVYPTSLSCMHNM